MEGFLKSGHIFQFIYVILLLKCIPSLVVLPEVTPTMKNLAIGLGVGIGLPVLILALVGLIILVVFIQRKSSKRYTYFNV